MCQTYVWPDLHHIGHLYRQLKIIYFMVWALTVCDIHFCIWKLPKFIFMGSSFHPFWSAKYLNFGGVSCEIRILTHSTQETYTLRKVKNQVLLFLFSWEPNLSVSWSTCSRMLFCLGLKLRFWNFKPVFLWMQFSLAATFFLYFWLSAWVEIYILKLSHGFLTFISFNIWR